MSLRLSLLIVIVVIGRVQGAVLPHAQLDERHRAFFQDYCVECHNADTHKGKLRLDDIAFSMDSPESAERWQKILNQLNSGEMPPDEAKQQPDRDRKTEFLDTLSHVLVTARKVIADQGGRITMRRLNRREYRNTMRTLLGVEVDLRDLPADGGTGSFDTVGASLFMSSDQLEQYLAIGRRALDDYFARVMRAGSGQQRYKTREEAEVSGNKRMNGLYTHTKEMHEKYVRWTAAVDAAASRPENVALASKLREYATKPRPSSGVPYPTPLLFYLDAGTLSGAPTASEFGLKDPQAAFAQEIQYQHYFSYYADYQALPNRDTGAWLLFYQAYREAYVSAEAKWPAGHYTLRVRVAANDAVPGVRRFIEVGQRGDDVSNFTVLSAHQVMGSLAEPQIIEVPVTISDTGKREFAIRERRPNSRTAEIRSYHDEFEKTGHGPVPAIWIDWAELEGPVDVVPEVTELRPGAQDGDGARDVIERFAARAFRGRSPEPEYVDRLVKLFETRRAAGDGYQEALKQPLSVVLASPSFLYLSEPSTEREHRLLDGGELATRLSYFLWSAPPDNELLALARRGELQNPDILRAQVDRMLASEKSWEFVSAFTHQWLGMDRLDFFQFDFKLHRAFDDSAKAAAREEVYQTFATLLHDDLTLRYLLKCDFVVVNGLLANYYGLEGVSGDSFRKVTLPVGSPRGGLLGMAAILAMGSNGQVTSPVERGAWVLRKLLHDPPPPAPANVPQLARLDGKLLSVRERMRAHQEEPQCASCHRKIDPIGFGLENFDAAGRWRTEDTYERKGVGRKTWAVDPAAAFYSGSSFQNYFELRDLIAAQADKFARDFTEALIEYGLGRPYGFSDEELAGDILSQAQRRDYAVREFIRALVTSEAFRRK